ncbi:unnamed protein product [Ilex paraguariensis]|uniref:Uncharacterized protein n=1 Tax=Ilex paraguariensis TaxID=185542 RepID=A0ABC8R8Y8_9AQUA
MEIAPAVSASNGAGEARDATGTSSSSVKSSSFSPSEKEMNNISNASVPSKYDDEADECRICWNPATLTILYRFLARAVEASSLFIKNVFFSGLITPTIVDASLNVQRKGGLPSWPHHVSHLPVCFQQRHSGA